MKYSKMQMHENVCVHQMSVIFILKIKGYFSSNKTHNYLHFWTTFLHIIQDSLLIIDYYSSAMIDLHG